MKLSQAIREGCKVFPKQARYLFFDRDRACALGAALAANDPSVVDAALYADAAYQMFPELAEDVIPEVEVDPLFGELTDLYWSIVYLNDELEWTREQIADWVEKEGL